MPHSGERFVREVYQMSPAYRKKWETKSVDLQNDKALKRPPFANCGADKLGPFLIKEGEKELWEAFHLLSN